MPAKTINYGLNRPTSEEYYNVEIQNGNMDVIDGQLKANADKAAANSSDISTIIGALERFSTISDITYYVNASTGKDSNDGLTSGNAFKNIQHVINILPKRIDHTVIINIASGTYPETVIINGFIGGATIILQGDSNASTSRTVDKIYASQNKCAINVIGLNLTTTSSSCIYSGVNSYFWISNCNLVGSSANGIEINGGYAYIQDSVISNKTNFAILAENGANVVSCSNSGLGNTGAGLYSYIGGKISKYGTSQPSATTPEYISTGGLIVDTNGIPSGVLSVSGGTMSGILCAQNNTFYSTKQVRNITLSTADPSGGGNGDLWFKYS